MTRAVIVDADKPRGAKAGLKHGVLLGAEQVQLAVRSRTTWRFEIATPAAVSTATIRSQVIWP